MNQLLFVAFAGSVLFACAPKTTTVVVTDNGNDTMPKAAIGEGKVVYLKQCDKCHDLKTIEDYTKDQWAKILPDMMEKAGLTDEESFQISEYIHWELEN